MASHINIEDRYRLSAMRERQMLNSGLYLGIASVAIAAGGAITSGVMADQAGKRQTASAQKAQKAYEEGLRKIGIMGPQLTPGELLTRDMPALTAAAQRSSQTLREEGEKFRPGGAEIRGLDVERARRAYGLIGTWSENRLPPEMESYLTRQAAERYGAMVTQPDGAGDVGGAMQAPGFAAARNLGLNLLQLQQSALEFGAREASIQQDWDKIARAYTVGEFEGPAQYALGAGQLQQQQMELQLGALTGQYNAMQNVGAAQFAQGMGQAQSWLSGSQSVAGALGGMSTGMSTYRQSAELGKIADQARYNQLMSQAVPSTTYKDVMSKPTPSMSDRPYKVPTSQYQNMSGTASVSQLRSPYA